MQKSKLTHMILYLQEKTLILHNDIKLIEPVFNKDQINYYNIFL